MNGTFVRKWRQEARKTEVRETGAHLPPATTQGASSGNPRRGSRGWGSSSDEDERYGGRRFNTPWVSSSSQPDVRIPTTPQVQLHPRIQSPPFSDVDCSLAGFCTVDCPPRRRQGLARRHSYSPAMLVKLTCHPHFSTFQRVRAHSRVPGPRTSPFSQSCLDDRPAQPASDRQVAYFVEEPLSSEIIGPACFGRSL